MWSTDLRYNLDRQSPLFSVILMFLSPDLKAIQFVVFSSLGFSLSISVKLQLKYKSLWLCLYCWFPCTLMTLCSKCWLGAKCLSFPRVRSRGLLWLMILARSDQGTKGSLGLQLVRGGRDWQYFGILLFILFWLLLFYSASVVSDGLMWPKISPINCFSMGRV